MDKSAALKGIYDSLSDELKEKAKACKTMDELTALVAKEGVELPDEALDQVAGGCGEEDGASPPSDDGGQRPRTPSVRKADTLDDAPFV